MQKEWQQSNDGLLTLSDECSNLNVPWEVNPRSEKTGWSAIEPCKVLRNRPNHDGYIRIRIGSRKDGSRRLVMSHRYTWEQANGPIPAGYEIHHKCRNRACSRLVHLELIEISKHKSLTNQERAGTGYYKAKRVRNEWGMFT